MAEPFLKLGREDRREVLEAAFGRGLARSMALLEKDVWVVWALEALFGSPYAEDLAFKGGTSLSKAYKVISRFSEDVDLTYDIRKLVDDKAGQPEALSQVEAKALGRKIREKLLPRFLMNEVLPYLEAQILTQGLPATVECESENLFISYESAADYPAYVRPRVKLEFGARSTGEPATRIEVTCDLDTIFAEVTFPIATPRVMTAERTFWEKATLAHVYCLEGKLRGAAGFARHWHDLVRLNRAGIADRAKSDLVLALAVADHKSKFFPAKDAAGEWVDYQSAVSGGLILIPRGDAYFALKADYEAMIEAGYLENGTETFEMLMDSCRELQDALSSRV